MTDVLRRVPGTDVAVHPVAVDGSVFGWASGVEETVRILDAMAGYGGNLVSTADHYAGGRSEVMIGGWLRSLSDRGRVLIATKIGRHPDAPGLSARNVVRAAEASLLRLETDYIDILALDGVDPSTPIDETLEAVDQLRRAGKVRFLSLSGFPADKVREVSALATSAVYPPIRLVSVAYSLMQRREFESELATVIDELDIGVVARRPLASGFLSGEFRFKDDVPSSPLFADALRHVGKWGSHVLQAVREVAEQRGDSMSRTALGWVLSKPGIVAAVVQVRSAEQLLALASPEEVVLTRHQVSVLDRASQR